MKITCTAAVNFRGFYFAYYASNKDCAEQF